MNDCGTASTAEQTDRASPRLERRLPILVILDRLRSAFNVGNIFRLAEAVRAEHVFACGYTAAPPHPKLAKTARGCDRLVPCTTFPDAAEAVRAAKMQGYSVYAVETAPLAGYYWRTPFRFPAAFVFGNEALGVQDSALAECDGVLRLPAFGRKNSINVGNCAAVVLYEALRQCLALDPHLEACLEGTHETGETS